MMWIRTDPDNPKKEELINLDHVVRFRLTDFGRFDAFLMYGTSIEMRSFDSFEIIHHLPTALAMLQARADVEEAPK